jgi:hypothetical protein
MLAGTGLTHAKGVYQQPEDFVKQSFAGSPPPARVLWLKDGLTGQIENILQHRYAGRRIRYWADTERSVWILEEIGKKKPITTGILIQHDKIENIKVLVFRETRGWEVKHAFFTNQFIGAELNNGNRLDRHIDGISGATLSVRALTRLARIALLLNKSIQP